MRATARALRCAAGRLSGRGEGEIRKRRGGGGRDASREIGLSGWGLILRVCRAQTLIPFEPQTQRLLLK
jgi:hypothetical protein